MFELLSRTVDEQNEQQNVDNCEHNEEPKTWFHVLPTWIDHRMCEEGLGQSGICPISAETHPAWLAI